MFIDFAVPGYDAEWGVLRSTGSFFFMRSVLFSLRILPICGLVYLLTACTRDRGDGDQEAQEESQSGSEFEIFLTKGSRRISTQEIEQLTNKECSQEEFGTFLFEKRQAIPRSLLCAPYLATGSTPDSHEVVGNPESLRWNALQWVATATSVKRVAYYRVRSQPENHSEIALIGLKQGDTGFYFDFYAGSPAMLNVGYSESWVDHNGGNAEVMAKRHDPTSLNPFPGSEAFGNILMDIEHGGKITRVYARRSDNTEVELPFADLTSVVDPYIDLSSSSLDFLPGQQNSALTPVLVDADETVIGGIASVGFNRRVRLPGGELLLLDSGSGELISMSCYYKEENCSGECFSVDPDAVLREISGSTRKASSVTLGEGFFKSNNLSESGCSNDSQSSDNHYATSSFNLPVFTKPYRVMLKAGTSFRMPEFFDFEGVVKGFLAQKSTAISDRNKVYFQDGSLAEVDFRSGKLVPGGCFYKELNCSGPCLHLTPGFVSEDQSGIWLSDNKDLGPANFKSRASDIETGSCNDTERSSTGHFATQSYDFAGFKAPLKSGQ